MIENVDEVKKAKRQIVEGQLVIWNTRLDVLKRTGMLSDLLEHLGSPIEHVVNINCAVGCIGPLPPLARCPDPLRVCGPEVGPEVGPQVTPPGKGR
jgi:hypothetical protein